MPDDTQDPQGTTTNPKPEPAMAILADDENPAENTVKAQDGPEAEDANPRT